MDMHIAQDAPLTGIDVDSLPPAEGEAVLRRQLAAAYRLVDYFGWTELIYGHLTARVPGEQPHFLINPFGLNYDEVTASNLVKIDLDGNNVGESKHPVNYAGFVIHSAVHMAHAARHKVVMHTHTRAGMAVCALKEGLLPISMAATAFHGKLAYHDYEGPSLDLDERGRLLKNLGDNPAMMLRNHGLLTTGRTVPEAFLRLYRLERACQIQVDAGAAGTLNIMGDNLAGKSGADLDGFADTKPARAISNSPPYPQARQGRYVLAALIRGRLSELEQRAQCSRPVDAVEPLDIGDTPAGGRLREIDRDPHGPAQIVERDLMVVLAPSVVTDIERLVISKAWAQMKDRNRASRPCLDFGLRRASGHRPDRAPKKRSGWS